MDICSIVPFIPHLYLCFCAAVDKMDGKGVVQKRHQQKHSGPKAEKKKLRKQGASTEEDERKRNPKAFAVQSAVRMAKTFHRLVLMALFMFTLTL